MTRFIYGRAINRAVQLLILMTLASCGGGDSGADVQPEMCFETSLQNCGPGPWDPFGLALSLAWNTGQCTQEVRCEAEPIQSDLGAGIVTDDFIASNWTTTTATETEPNNSTSEASPFVVRENNGLRILGSVNDSTDLADFTAFSAQSFNLHATYLCRAVGTCTLPFLQSNEIYIELLDQNGNILRTTDMMQSSNGHEIAFTPSQGLRYFVVVRALNTGGVDFEYDLVFTVKDQKCLTRQPCPGR